MATMYTDDVVTNSTRSIFHYLLFQSHLFFTVNLLCVVKFDRLERSTYGLSEMSLPRTANTIYGLKCLMYRYFLKCDLPAEGS